MSTKSTETATAADESSLPNPAVKRVAVLAIVVFAVLAVALVVCALSDARVGLIAMTIAAQVMILFGALYFAFEGNMFDRLVGLAGAESLVANAQISLLDLLPRYVAPGKRIAIMSHRGDFGSVSADALVDVCVQWAIGLLIVFVVFVILGFGRQMLRKERTDMVRSLSHGLMASVMMVGASGWMFAPVLLRYFGAGKGVQGGFTGPLAGFAGWATLGVVVIAVLATAAMLVASLRWQQDLDRLPAARAGVSHTDVSDGVARLDGANAADGGSSDSTSGTSSDVFRDTAGSLRPDNPSDVEIVAAARNRHGWIGAGLMAPMLSGFIVYLALVALLLLVG